MLDMVAAIAAIGLNGAAGAAAVSFEFSTDDIRVIQPASIRECPKPYPKTPGRLRIADLTPNRSWNLSEPVPLGTQ